MGHIELDHSPVEMTHNDVPGITLRLNAHQLAAQSVFLDQVAHEALDAVNVLTLSIACRTVGRTWMPFSER